MGGDTEPALILHLKIIPEVQGCGLGVLLQWVSFAFELTLLIEGSIL